MTKKSVNSKSASLKPVTMNELGKFTDEVILPGVEKIVEYKITPIQKDVSILKTDVSGLKADISTLKKDVTNLKVEVVSIREEMATKDDLKKTEVKILQAVDKVVTAFDKHEKDHIADKLLHDRHENRLERIETAVGIK